MLHNKCCVVFSSKLAIMQNFIMLKETIAKLWGYKLLKADCQHGKFLLNQSYCAYLMEILYFT